MSHKNTAGKLIVFSLVLISLMGFTVGRVLSGPPERVKVLISYNTPPGAAEQAQVKQAGGHVRYRFYLAAFRLLPLLG